MTGPIRVAIRRCVLAGAALAIAIPAAAVPATASSGGTYTAFFADGPLAGSGWASCSDPIGVSIDSTRLPKPLAHKAAVAVVRAFELWSKGTGLTFAFRGIVPVDYDDRTGVVTPSDGIDRPRHLYLAMLPDSASSILSDRVVGLGEPTRVDPTNREILAGEGTFELDYVRRASVGQLVALFAHELGHAFGLGHSGDKHDVMYPIVTEASRLGAGDLAGVASVMRPCRTGDAPSRDYPMQ